MSRSPVVVLAVVGALGVVFAVATSWLVRREEKRGVPAVEPRPRKVKEPRVHAPKPVKPVKVRAERPVKEPRVRPAKTPRELSRPEPEPQPIEEPTPLASLPDPRRESLVLNLDAFTEFRSR